MIKEVDERLKMLNEENYDTQFYWSNETEMREDIEEKDIQDVGINWEGAGEYVYSSLGCYIYTLEEALECEFKQVKDNIEHYSNDTQKEILNWFYNEVKTIESKIEVGSEYNDADSLKDIAISQLEEEIQDLKDEGYNTQFIEDTMTFRMSCEKNITNVYFLVVK